MHKENMMYDNNASLEEKIDSMAYMLNKMGNVINDMQNIISYQQEAINYLQDAMGNRRREMEKHTESFHTLLIVANKEDNIHENNIP